MTNVTLTTAHPDTLVADGDGWDDGGSPSSRRSRLHAVTDPSSTIPTYVGVVVTVVGFVLIAVGWSHVAGLVDVWRQMPYLLSAGLPGLGLVMTGLVIVNVSARRQDAAARARQLAMVAEALRDLKRSLDS